MEDRYTLAGHIAAMLNNYDKADELFSKSSDPHVRKYAALEVNLKFYTRYALLYTVYADAERSTALGQGAGAS